MAHRLLNMSTRGILHEIVTINQGRIDLSFHQVVAEIISDVLQDPRLLPGISINVSSGPHREAFCALQRAETDILVGWFDGSHGAYISAFRDDLIIVGDSRDATTVPGPAVYNPYCIWAVPNHVPELIVPDVEALADPNVAKRFATELSSNKRVLQGVGAGAGISRFSSEMVKEYGLDRQGWEFRTGTQEDCFENVERRIIDEGESCFSMRRNMACD